VLSVCDARVLDVPKYLEARRGCEAGTIVIAKAFKTPDRSLEVRLGRLPFANDATFLAAFPTLLAAGERDERDRAELSAFVAALDEAVKLAGSTKTAPEAAKKLAHAVAAHVGRIARSDAFRSALASRDAGLSPALAQIGKAKSAAVSRMSAVDLSGLMRRGEVAAFADLTADGIVDVHAPSPADALATEPILPQGMAAYRKGFRMVETMARARKPTAKAIDELRTHAGEAAAVCGAAEKKLDASERALVGCAFGVEACDAARTDALASAIASARAEAERSHAELVAAMRGAAYDAREDLENGATASGCLDPWW
jgi:hypothetical protein